MAERPDFRRRTKILLRAAAAALPVTLASGLGFGLAVVMFAAAVVARAADPDL